MLLVQKPIQMVMQFTIGIPALRSQYANINFDFLLFSIVDAILGALTLPDIGQLFPGLQLFLICFCLVALIMNEMQIMIQTGKVPTPAYLWLR